MLKKYFYGQEISQYGIENGYVDYAAFSKAFDAVLNNNIIQMTQEIGFWELVNGSDYDEEEDTFAEVFQWYIVSDQGASIIETHTDELLYYNEELDMYVWGVTHWGTAWDYVLTDIEI